MDVFLARRQFACQVHCLETRVIPHRWPFNPAFTVRIRWTDLSVEVE